MISSLRFKLITASSILVILCASAFLLLSMKEHENVYQKTMISTLESISSNLAEDLVSMLSKEPDSIAMATKLLALDNYQHIKYAVIYDKNFEKLQLYISPTKQGVALNKSNVPSFNIKEIVPGISLRKGDLVSYRPIGDTMYVLGYLLVVLDYQGPLTQSNKELLSNSLPLASLILVVVTVLSAWVNRRVLLPINKLAEFANSIESSSNYHQRFHYEVSGEVKFLSQHINAMLERIEAQNEQTYKYTIQLEEQQKALSKYANYDLLTGLPNRKYFMEVLSNELSRARRCSENLMVMFLDLDHFKAINDSLGHKVGDQLLIKVGELIRQQLRDSDVLSRLGGDEFIILTPDLGDDMGYSSSTLAERIIHALELPITIEEWDVQTGVSIGIADAQSANYNPHTLVSNADLAMYRAKDSGRNQFSLFQQELQASSVRKMHIANALAKALQDGEFSVFYQAKVNSDGSVYGFEALLRWHSSFDGPISPVEFIPVAEHSGRITAISRWVIAQVFQDLGHMKRWSDAPLHVSLNLSALDIKDPELLDYICSQQKLFDIEPAWVEFEVTESAYLDNLEEAEHFFKSLRKSGYRIALDDFGTGYSSMSYLTQIELDTLKIDRSFINKLCESEKDRLIVEAIINLAHKLNLTVCAEGVEGPEQVQALLELECEQMQGYYFSKPAELMDVPQILSAKLAS